MAEINTWPGWECVRQLGAGSFGKVYEIQKVENGKIYKSALKVMTIPQNDADIENMRQAFAKRRDLIYSLVSKIDGIKCLRPQGAFYLLCDISAFGMGSDEFCTRLLEEEQLAARKPQPNLMPI